MKQCKKMMPWTRGANRRTLKSCRESGITHVEILTVNLEGHACVCADELAKKPIPVDQIPELPLPGCDAKSCGCVWCAHFEPLTEERIKEIEQQPLPFTIRIRLAGRPEEEVVSAIPPPIPEKEPSPILVILLVVLGLGFLLWIMFWLSASIWK